MGPEGGKMPLNTPKMSRILQKYTHAKSKFKMSIYVIIEGVIGGTGARCRYSCGGLKNLTLLGVGRGPQGGKLPLNTPIMPKILQK